MKIALWIAAGLVIVVGLVLLIGSRLPVRHRARVELRINAAPQTVYALISDVARAPDWREDVKSIELLADENGVPRFRETGANGVVTYRIETAEAPRRFVTRIADIDLGYGGSWTYDVMPDGAGSVLVITEDGEVHSALFRFMARFVFGHYRSIENYLGALAAALGESARPRRLTDEAS